MARKTAPAADLAVVIAEIAPELLEIAAEVGILEAAPEAAPAIEDAPEVTKKRRITLNRVKAAFASRDLKVTLVWDRTHFHFEFDGSANLAPEVNLVPVPRIGDMTETEWVSAAERMIELAQA